MNHILDEGRNPPQEEAISGRFVRFFCGFRPACATVYTDQSENWHYGIAYR